MADKVDPRTGEVVTTNYGWVKPTVGASVDAWGGYINTDLDGIDSTVKSVSNAIPAASSTTPAMNGTAAIGSGTTWAKADHVHPSDTSRLALAGGTMTGALTPSQTAGIVGTTAANNANAGAVGEHVIAEVFTNVTMANNAIVNVVSVSLTAGDWDVEGNLATTFSVGGKSLASAISTTSVTFPTTYLGNFAIVLATQGLVTCCSPTGMVRVSLAATTTVYLIGQATFSSGTCNGQGSIRARRVR